MDIFDESKLDKVKLQDIYADIYEDCDSALADDFSVDVNRLADDEGYIDINNPEFQLYIRDFLELHENDYQYDLLKRALGRYYDSSYDIVDDDIEESYEVLEEDEIDDNATFEEIIYRMECAEIYEDLYNAAMLIVDPKLQNEVTKLIQQCEDDGDEVEEAYSIVTSDLLDMHLNDKNEEFLNETKLQEAKDIKTILKELDVSSFEELNEKIEELYNEGEIDEEYDDFIDISSEQEEKCIDYINRRSEVTNTDWKDELGIEEDYVKTAIEEMIKSLSLEENKKLESEEPNTHSLLSKVFANYPDISDEDEDYLNGLNYEELVSEIKNRGWEDLLEESKIEEVKKTLDDLYSDAEMEALWNKKFKELVPKEGKANNDIGEIMRCFASLSHALFQNGDIMSKLYQYGQMGYYNKAESLDDAVHKLGDTKLIDLVDKMWNTRSEAAYDHYMAEFYEYFVNTYLKDNKEIKEESEEYEPNIGSSSYDLGIDFNSYLEENDNVCSLLDYVKFTLATMEADLGPSGLDSFEEVPDFDEILDNIKQDIGQGDITIDDWNKEEAEDYYNDWLDDLNLEESKKIKTEVKDKESLEDIAKECIECDIDYIKEVIEEEGSKKSFIERAMEDPCDFGWDSIIPDEYYEDKRLYALIYDLIVKKENKEESEENPQEFDYRLLSRLKSDCDYYLGNGNRNAEHCLWAKNEQGQIDKMREIYNKLKEKPEWLSEEDINNYAKEMGVVDLPSTIDGTAEKEVQDMLDRAEKRSKEGLTESNEDKFNGIEFEKKIPHVMRYKEYDVKDNADGKTLYWVTQQFFTLPELKEFQQAFIEELVNDKFGFTEAYVTVRDLSHYDLEEDYEEGIVCYVTPYELDYVGYEEACEDYRFDFNKGWLDESKKVTEAEDMEAVKDEIKTAIEDSESTDLEKEQVAGSIEVLKTDEESAIEGYEDFNEETAKVVDKELADAVEEQMEEIIEDEKEHIEKLDTIQDAIEDNKEVKEEAVTIQGMKDIIDNAKNDFQVFGAIHTLGFADPELSNDLRLQYNEMQNNGMSLDDIKAKISQQLVPAMESKSVKTEEIKGIFKKIKVGDTLKSGEHTIIVKNIKFWNTGDKLNIFIDCDLDGKLVTYSEKDFIEMLNLKDTIKNESKELKKEDKTIWSSEYKGDETTADEAYQEYLDEFEPTPIQPKSFEDWLEDTFEDWLEAESNAYIEEHPEVKTMKDWEIDEIDFKLREKVQKEIEANMDDLKEQYEEYVNDIKESGIMTKPSNKEKWLTGWFEQDAEAQWEVMDEDFSFNVWPMIQNQCKDDILIMLGSVGRWNGTFDGGKIIHADEKNIRNIMGDYDEVSVTADNEGHISMGFDHHDGTDGMFLYTIPEDLTELAKAMGYEDADELDMDIRQDNVDMEELAKNVNKLVPIINK